MRNGASHDDHDKNLKEYYKTLTMLVLKRHTFYFFVLSWFTFNTSIPYLFILPV